LSPDSQSSTYLDSGSEDEAADDDPAGLEKRRRRRDRSRSITSMPGSIDFGMRDEDHNEGDDDGRESEDEVVGDGYGYEGEEEGIENEEEAAEEAFDEDLLATGEMKNVPFL
jgi:phosphatidate phosphatase LPIN